MADLFDEDNDENNIDRVDDEEVYWGINDDKTESVSENWSYIKLQRVKTLKHWSIHVQIPSLLRVPSFFVSFNMYHCKVKRVMFPSLI